MNDQAATLNDSARDWASWNDTYAFIADGNSTYIRSNLQPDTSFRNLQVSLMLFINPRHQVIFAKGYDLGAEHDLIIPDGLKSSLASDSLLTSHTPPGQSMHGVMSLPQGLMLIAGGDRRLSRSVERRRAALIGQMRPHLGQVLLVGALPGQFG
ncbi:MAG: CHASE4 domain-containing protein [Thermoleophilia bacterium]